MEDLSKRIMEIIRFPITLEQGHFRCLQYDPPDPQAGGQPSGNLFPTCPMSKTPTDIHEGALADSHRLQIQGAGGLYRVYGGHCGGDRPGKIRSSTISAFSGMDKMRTLNVQSININDLLELILKRLRPIAAKNPISSWF